MKQDMCRVRDIPIVLRKEGVRVSRTSFESARPASFSVRRIKPTRLIPDVPLSHVPDVDHAYQYWRPTFIAAKERLTVGRLVTASKILEATTLFGFDVGPTVNALDNHRTLLDQPSRLVNRIAIRTPI
jgi:hypothetical protein